MLILLMLGMVTYGGYFLTAHTVQQMAIAAAPSAHALLCVPILGCSCNVTASDLEFDSFSPLDGMQEASGMIEVDCTGIADVAPSVIVRLDDGLYGTMAARQMRTTGGQQLPYNTHTTSALNAAGVGRSDRWRVEHDNQWRPAEPRSLERVARNVRPRPPDDGHTAGRLLRHRGGHDHLVTLKKIRVIDRDGRCDR